ncbi:hypothetical protein CU097_010513 [Rhizopus azygosporus]|uniref:SAC3/GANP/THP3 conserved domain-containing protein n=1 Tax=Rhizopus azygosporus TaxID=86630 RepID=A0A367KAD0_RHIAZ|nr:hypothetical protein CU097_010513 [Rhizopus azygosporus]
MFHQNSFASGVGRGSLGNVINPYKKIIPGRGRGRCGETLDSEIDKLELDEYDNVNRGRVVKAYIKSVAENDQLLPSDVRCPKALVSTLDYLIDEILSKNPLKECHAFIRDRTRSIRQDFTLQNIRNEVAVEVHERIARFHILCLHEMRDLDESKFCVQQEIQQLQEACSRNRKHYRRLQIAMSSQQTSTGDSVVCFQEGDKPAVEITRCGPLRRPYESPSVKVCVLDDGSEFICDRRAIDPMEISHSESLLNPPWNLISRCLSKILQERLP